MAVAGQADINPLKATSLISSNSLYYGPAKAGPYVS